MFTLFLSTSLGFAEPLSLQQSLDLIHSQNPEVQIARLQTDQANLERLKVLTHAVSLEASGSWLDFGEPLDVYLMGDGSTDVDCSSFEAFGFGDLCSSFSEPLRLRDQRIFDGNIQVAIPLSALYSIIEGHSASQHMVNIKALEVEQTRQRIEISVIEIYLQILEIQAQIVLLDDTLERLQSHQRSVLAFVAQGFLHEVQAKEIEYVIAQTQLGKNQATQGAQLLAHQMELLLGLNEPFEPIELTDNILPPSEGTVQDSLSYKIATERRAAAQDGLQAAYGELIPTVALLAAQTNTQGQGALNPTSQQYVGLSVQGKFGWGQKWMTVKQRQLDYTMAEQAVELQTNGIQLLQQQLKNQWVNSQQGIEIAQLKVEIEATKQQQAQIQFRENHITVTDLLDIEADFTQANIDLIQAKHQSIIAQAKYQQSINSDTLRFTTP